MTDRLKCVVLLSLVTMVSTTDAVRTYSDSGSMHIFLTKARLTASSAFRDIGALPKNSDSPSATNISQWPAAQQPSSFAPLQSLPKLKRTSLTLSFASFVDPLSDCTSSPTSRVSAWMRFTRVHADQAPKPRVVNQEFCRDILPSASSSRAWDRRSREASRRVAPVEGKILVGTSVQPSQPPVLSSPTPSLVSTGWDHLRNAVIDRATSALRRLHELWEPLQVSHCGKYSVERMIAFDEYCHSASKLRVASVCLLAPLPAVFVVVLMEIPPLRPPEDGCLENYVFWVRHWTAVGVILWSGNIQCKQWIPELPLSHTRMIVMSFACSAVYVALNVLVGYLWIFPIPFLAVLGGTVMFPIWVVGIILAVGYRKLMDITNIRERLRRFLELQSAESALMILYPANNAIFLAVPIWLRTAYMAVLPLINIVMKNVVAAKGSHLEDRLPETVVFSVDVFSALYSVFCMRSANSLSSVAAVVTIDIVLTALAVQGLHERTLFTQGLILETTPLSRGPTRRHAIAADLVEESNASPESAIPIVSTKLKVLGSPDVSHLLAKVLYLLHQPGQLDPDTLRDIRLLSGTKHSLSPGNMELLYALEKRAIYDNTRVPATRVSFSQIKARYASGSIRKTSLQRQISDGSLKLATGLRVSVAVRKSSTSTPGPQILENVAASPSLLRESQLTLHPLLEARHPALKDALQLIRKKNTLAVQEVLQLLFSSEYLVLIAYVQCIIPPMFILYMLALHHLPNVAYYPRAVELLSDDQLRHRMDTIALYWVLELLLLLGVWVVLRGKFALQTLYQVGFVLESHALLVQCKLVFTLIFAVQSSAEHYGECFALALCWIERWGCS
jgi:hypothetical protein